MISEWTFRPIHMIYIDSELRTSVLRIPVRYPDFIVKYPNRVFLALPSLLKIIIYLQGREFQLRFDLLRLLIILALDLNKNGRFWSFSTSIRILKKKLLKVLNIFRSSFAIINFWSLLVRGDEGGTKSGALHIGEEENPITFSASIVFSDNVYSPQNHLKYRYPEY